MIQPRLSRFAPQLLRADTGVATQIDRCELRRVGEFHRWVRTFPRRVWGLALRTTSCSPRCEGSRTSSDAAIVGRHQRFVTCSEGENPFGVCRRTHCAPIGSYHMANEQESARVIMTVSRPLFIVVGVLIGLGAASAASAQPGMGRGPGMPMYDRKAEVTLTGTVEAVETVIPPGCHDCRSGCHGCAGSGGVHLTLKTETEPIDVHLGPSWFLKETGLTAAKGDAVTILGSRVTQNEKPVLLARQVTKGDNTWTLRDSSGRPLWSGHAHGTPPTR